MNGSSTFTEMSIIAESPRIKLVDIGRRIKDCKDCGRTVLISNLRNHAKKYHNKYNCSKFDCDFEGNSGLEYRAHLSLHEFLNPCRCHLRQCGCGEVFINRTVRKLHYMKKCKNMKKRVRPVNPPLDTVTKISHVRVALNVDRRQNITKGAPKKVYQIVNYKTRFLHLRRPSYIPAPRKRVSAQQKENIQKVVAAAAISKSKSNLYKKSLSSKRKKHRCLYCPQTFQSKSAQLLHVMFSHLQANEVKVQKIPNQMSEMSLKTRKQDLQNQSEKSNDVGRENLNVLHQTGSNSNSPQTIDGKVKEVVQQISEVNLSSRTQDLKEQPESTVVVVHKAVDAPTSKKNLSENEHFHSSVQKLSSYLAQSLSVASFRKVEQQLFKSTPIVHLRNIGNQVMKQCLICNEDLILEGLIEHVERHKKEAKNKCQVCHFKTRSELLMDDHLNAHFGINRWKCALCSLAFVSHNEMKKHDMYDHSHS